MCGGGVLTSRLMLLAMNRATRATRRGGGAAAKRHASNRKWLAQGGKPAASEVSGGARRGEARAVRCVTESCACGADQHVAACSCVE
eukprot:2310244-Pleurochrysis_carterae.AAC.1